MTLLYETDEGQAEKLAGMDPEALAKQVAEAALNRIGCPYETQVGLLLTSDEQIRQMNRDYRGMDRSTDVLSFPMLDYDTPGSFDFLKEETADAECFDPVSGELVLGDIVISADHVLEQAGQYGHSLQREFAFLVAHSMLHLMGYDHMQPEEEEQMTSLQEQILSGLGITRAIQ